MKFTPKTKQEINEDRMLPAGEYSFQISGAEDTTSKAGNEMIKLTLRVFKPDGKFLLVDDYLLEAVLYKILHLCEATGLKDKYDAGQIAAQDFIGKTGMLKLGVQKSEQYGDKNQVKDYIVDGKAEIPKDNLDKVIDGDDDMEDTIPF